MRIVTWNVNGLATTLQYHPWSEKKSYKHLLDALRGDIICFQEVKTQRQKLTRDMAMVPGYDGYFSFPKSKHGYSGVATYVKQPLRPLEVGESITEGLSDGFLASLKTQPPQLLDQEGRCLRMDFGMFVLFNIYFPNGNGDDARFEYKMDYHACVRQQVDMLISQGRAVVLLGDVNALASAADHADPAQSLKDWGITDFMDLPHRQWLHKLIDPVGPLIDVCRKCFPLRTHMFTCWNLLTNARPANFGTRIDYILITKDLLPWFDSANIQPEIFGSDHCPVVMDMVDTLDGTKLRDLLTHPNALASPFHAANFSEFKQMKLSSFFGKKPLAPAAPTTGALQNSPLHRDPAVPLSSATPSLTSADAAAADKPGGSPSPVATVFAENMAKRKSVLDSAGSPSPSPKRPAPTKPKQRSVDAFFRKPSTGSTKAMASPSPKSDIDTLLLEDGDLAALVQDIDQRHEKQQDWANLFRPQSIPTCTRHRLPCTEFTVNKKGPNQGRRFYLCSRPIGPSSEKNSDHYRCDFFLWKSEKSKK
ncbi:DNase I-like protein [Hesseltinella vesiculosa]|uniref:DNA-(apurinic or apyrimidinic site) endonuclease n=1 Tax=Hesseltinella vesiculosa TaxID=101127 RepID=A0A1X2GE29_9FUNG|nr:DNase I-like protein [Hesseltinella vesiculosa]